MTPTDPATRRRRPHPPAAGAGALAAATLVVALLCTYVLTGCGRTGSVSARVSCFGAGTPQVSQVPASSLVGLRASVQRVLPERVGRLYEEGTALASAAWTDAAPAPPPVSASELRPSGYEMRWIAPNGDDVAATVLVFSSDSRAARFMTLAASARCHEDGAQDAAARPPLGMNLAWVDPDGAAEADVYLARGRRVYRVADVPAGQRSGGAGGGALASTFFTIDALACLLPGARCNETSSNVPA